MYPTLEQVKVADREQLARWYRFLRSPGESAIDTEQFKKKLEEEKQIMDLICQRFRELGGFNPYLSKKIGW